MRPGTLAANAGSSPLARGLPPALPRHPHPGRIIPARAGFTLRPALTAGFRRDHPRSRGVYIALRFSLTMRWGSSPLARGLPLGLYVPGYRGRIIPARAGFTPSPRIMFTVNSDHPRSRGVYLVDGEGTHRWRGSSPLARGLLCTRSPGRPASGIIPARAGFTLKQIARDVEATDHPRSRGVYVSGTNAHVRIVGSSPLARGLLPSALERVHGRRIIPARAGFTGSSGLGVWSGAQSVSEASGVDEGSGDVVGGVAESLGDAS